MQNQYFRIGFCNDLVSDLWPGPCMPELTNKPCHSLHLSAQACSLHPNCTFGKRLLKKKAKESKNLWKKETFGKREFEKGNLWKKEILERILLKKGTFGKRKFLKGYS